MTHTISSHTISIEPLGVDVECPDGSTVLEACLREGVWLPHACTHGTCGTCKAEVIDGDFDHGDASPYALLDTERDDGMALLCVARPTGDMTVEGDVEVEEGIEVFKVRDFVGTVAALDDVSPDVRRLVLDLDSPLGFNPGQYVQLVLPNGETRPYSMASPPSSPGRIELNIKRTAGGAATDGWIFDDLAVGDTVPVTGPYGRFAFRPFADKPVLLLGSGTGLAPLKSMVAHIVELTGSDDGWEHDVVLYHGVGTTADLYDREWFEQVAADHDWFTYRPAVSREECGGRQGRVPALLVEDYPRAGGHVAYICGRPEMVDDTIKALMGARLFPRDIYREDFFDAADKAAGATAISGPLIRR